MMDVLDHLYYILGMNGYGSSPSEINFPFNLMWSNGYDTQQGGASQTLGLLQRCLA
jgi:hypothetical protein